MPVTDSILVSTKSIKVKYTILMQKSQQDNTVVDGRHLDSQIWDSSIFQLHCYLQFLLFPLTIE